MTMNLYARTYQATGAEATDPNHALVLLFEGAVRFLLQAREAIARRDYYEQSRAITRTQRIFSTLLCALDRDANPELYLSLSGTYTWIHSSLTEVSVRDDAVLLEEVLEVVTGLCDAWRQARQNLADEQAAQDQFAAA